MKPNPLTPSASLLCKLASVAVHADEMLSAKGHALDKVALQSAIDDQEVRDWIKAMTAMAMAPVKREPGAPPPALRRHGS